MTQAAAGRPSDSGDTGDTGNIADASVIDADAVAAALRVNVETGPSAHEAASRLANSGPNELRLALRAPAWRRACWRSSRTR